MRSARGRLLVGLIGLTVLGMAVIDCAAVVVLDAYATNRVDRTLVEVQRNLPPLAGHLVTVDGVAVGQQMPEGFLIVLVAPDGRILERTQPVSLTGEPVTAPTIPDPVPPGWAAEPLTLSSSDTRFRMRSFDLGEHAEILLAGQNSPTQFRYAIIGGSLNAGENAVNQLVVFELVATGAAAIAVSVFGAVLFNRSLREQKQSEQRLQDFVAAASHELRTPLTTIRGWAELQRVSGKPELAAVALSRIEQQADRMSHLVDQLLHLVSLAQDPLRDVPREPVDLRGIAAESIADVSALHPDRRITMDASRESVVAGDEQALRQVVRNLVDNALKHTPPRTSVTVSVQDGCLTVADEGPGMAPDVVARVFERFYRAEGRTSSGGTGLGLSIVQAIVLAHGGEITVTSEPGRGSTFRVSLPTVSSLSDQ
ncbi:sensor histidine kinase [Actinocrispum wychmicini]|uniref:histidine kinase n=1 Tax=Actinocrispum wychmicini TaxID=1213861 RepID=A0A4V2S8Y9_9PSEU|nr:HAMP domain-containing sensor histidine kinase [Actinocrispum wychmicini]TCO65500.1 two-component system OmpR family sensor kinase [Actinocrispum wychmicini]